jgi:hypothetical protein
MTIYFDSVKENRSMCARGYATAVVTRWMKWCVRSKMNAVAAAKFARPPSDINFRISLLSSAQNPEQAVFPGWVLRTNVRCATLKMAG